MEALTITPFRTIDDSDETRPEAHHTPNRPGPKEIAPSKIRRGRSSALVLHTKVIDAYHPTPLRFYPRIRDPESQRAPFLGDAMRRVSRRQLLSLGQRHACCDVELSLSL
jgi:hypothetical protein